jgi:cobalt-zinc-cadmium resistance protein CzcA
VIPLAMLFAVSMMNLFGVSGNLMSLGAIDFGLIVDGAVIIVEATMHHLGISGMVRKLSQREMDEEVEGAAKKMMHSAVFGQIIILIVYLPILSLIGIEGKMFKPMAQTVAFAIVGALILSLTYVPMISALLLSKKTGHKENLSDRLINKILNIYQPSIALALRHRMKVLIISGVALVGSLLLFNTLGGEFIPTLDEGDFAVETRLLTGSTLKGSADATQKAARALLDQFPEVENVMGKIGTSEIPTDPMPMEASDLMVVLKDQSEWTSASTRDELAEKMSKVLEEKVPGVSFGFQQPIQMRFNELMTGARQDVVIKIFGEDLEELAYYAGKIGKIAGTVEGASDIFVEPIGGLRQVVIRFDRKKLAMFGLSVEEVNRTIRTGFAGEVAGQVFEGERRFDMVVRLDTRSRFSVDDIQKLFITTPQGRPVAVEQVAEVKLESGPNQIQREDAKRRITVGFNVRGRDVQSLVEEINKKIEQKIKFKPGYFLQYSGSFKNLEEAKTRLAIAVPVALLLIFALLFFAFNSIRHGLLIYTAIPLSAIGGILGLWLRDMPFSISAGVGFIALFGVAVLNGIVLIAEFNHIRSEEPELELNDVVKKGTTVRLRPVIMTAMVASLGFLPMALSQSSGSEVQRPLATVVIGGLVSATLLTLVVLPVLYTYFEKRHAQHV